MAVSPEFRDYVVEQLSLLEDSLGEVFSRPMFGGFGLYCAGLFFGLLAEDVFYLKVDDSNREQFESRGSGPFRIRNGKSRMNYYEVPSEILEDREALASWARQSVSIAARAAE